MSDLMTALFELPGRVHRIRFVPPNIRYVRLSDAPWVGPARPRTTILAIAGSFNDAIYREAEALPTAWPPGEAPTSERSWLVAEEIG